MGNIDRGASGAVSDSFSEAKVGLDSIESGRHPRRLAVEPCFVGGTYRSESLVSWTRTAQRAVTKLEDFRRRYDASLPEGAAPSVDANPEKGIGVETVATVTSIRD